MNVLNHQIEKIKRNRVTFLLIVLTAIGTLIVGYLADRLFKSIALLTAMWLCSIVIDMYAARKPANFEITVRRPGLETIFIILFALCMLVYLSFQFMGLLKWENFGNFGRIAKLLTCLLFLFPVALAITMFILRYRFKELGFRFNGLLLAIPVIMITAIAGLIFFPKNFNILTFYKEIGGVKAWILELFIGAALAEEFWRYIAQTRFGALLKNNGLGWFLASALWALMHVPVLCSQGLSVGIALLSALHIIPIGLMWGYLTYRTKSILPSILAHGMNIWGLQNF